MTILQRIKELASAKNISLAELERKTYLSSGSITKWDKSSPSVDKIEKVAKHFNVSVDYLLGREEKTHYTSKDLDEMIDNAMFYDGKPLSDNDREIVKAFLEGKFGSK